MFVGGQDDGRNRRDEILELVDSDWTAVATMQMGRDGHEISAIDYSSFCK